MCQGEATGWLKGFGRINMVPRGGALGKEIGLIAIASGPLEQQ